MRAYLYRKKAWELGWGGGDSLENRDGKMEGDTAVWAASMAGWLRSKVWKIMGGGLIVSAS